MFHMYLHDGASIPVNVIHILTAGQQMIICTFASAYLRLAIAPTHICMYNFSGENSLHMDRIAIPRCDHGRRSATPAYNG